MKAISIAVLFLLSVSAKAEIGAFFPENQATLVIQGKNEDASKLYEAMKVTPSAANNTLTKHISYETMYANPVFDLTCNKSQLTNASSCTLKFFSPGAVIMKDQKAVLMGINDRFDAPDIAKLFNETSNNSYQAESFLSEDGKLRIWKTFNSSGEVVSFTMSYN